MFGSKKTNTEVGQNVLLLDIENASVGVALAHLTPGSAPVLFAEQRMQLAVPRSLHGANIEKQIKHAAHSALEHIGLVAARLRGHPQTAHKGEFTHTAVFLGAPWGTPNLAAGKASFIPSLQNFLTHEVDAIAPDVPLSFYTNADAAVYGSSALTEGGTQLLALVRGEITELILIGNEGVLGYGTLPVGSRSLYRTLQTHAGLSLAEISSALALANTSANPYREPMEAAGRHIVEQFGPGVEALAHSGTPSGVIVVAEEPLGEWFAHSLEEDDSLGALFTRGATVHTFGAKHAAQLLGGHSISPDLHLSLSALFAKAKLA